MTSREPSRMQIMNYNHCLFKYSCFNGFITFDRSDVIRNTYRLLSNIRACNKVLYFVEGQKQYSLGVQTELRRNETLPKHRRKRNAGAMGHRLKEMPV